ncbi:MAG: hypothetical protein NC086_06930 [Alistipes sp.]|nr:hypothetical protein [Alistipes sp.]
MNWIQNLIIKLLKITPATERSITIRQAYTFQQNIQKNKVWYQGEPAELEQFFKNTAFWDCDRTRFWAATPNGKIRKIHSGVVSMVIDRYKDIVMSDFNGVSFPDKDISMEKLWTAIEEYNRFTEIMEEAIQQALAVGDGAFKISTDPLMEYPVISFYEMENVAFDYLYGRLNKIKFYTDYSKNGKSYRLEECYGIGYVKYKLYDDQGRECKMEMLEETKELQDMSFKGDYIMGVPFRIFKSNKWKGRGKALFDTKSDVLDALDEVISQWLDAVRLGRIKRYIPQELIPRNAETGELLPANPFDNDFMAIEGSMKENANQKIDISQPSIAYEAYLSSYTNFLDMVLQGIMSPSTLGIDLKKTDNAESQREKEKITLHVRGKIISALNEAVPEVIKVTLATYGQAAGKIYEQCEPVLNFGEYASPDFDSTIETVAKARSAGTMSIEKSVEEMYGDSMSEEEKAEEVIRIKEEQGIIPMEEPAVNMQNEETFIEEKM